MQYKAFISYSHAADGKLAPAVQRALHRIAKPWYRLRTMRVFRDQTNLAASPGLWTSIEAALNETEFFLYMASPPAAQSPWVQKEVEWWLANRSAKTFLVLLTDGDLVWDRATHDLDCARSTALPRQLAKAFAEEPLYVDLRWARHEDQLSSRHTQFRAAILDLAATLLQRNKDELDGDDVRQYRRTRRVAGAGIAALATLFVAASLAAYLATQQSRLATSRALGARSEAVLPTNPELAMLLAQEALRFRADEQAEYALRRAYVRNPWRMIHHAEPGRNVVATFAGADSLVAAEPGKRAVVWGTVRGTRLAELPAQIGDRVALSQSADGSLIALATDDDTFALYDGKTWTAVATLPGNGPRISRDGTVLTASQGNGVKQWRLPSLKERTVEASLPDGYAVHDVSTDGSLLFLARDEEVTPILVMDAASGRMVARLPERVFRAGAGLSPDGRTMVAEPTDEGTVELWDAPTGRMLRVLEVPRLGDIGWTTYVAFSPDGQRLVTGNRNGVVQAWDLRTGEWLGASTTHRNDVTKIEFSPDGETMLSVAGDGTACLWDTAAMRCLVTLGGKGDDAWDVGFAADSRHFLTTHQDGTVRVWQRETWYPSWTLAADQSIIGDDGRSVLGISHEGPARLWDVATGKPAATMEGSAGEVEAMALDQAASLIAVAPVDGVVRLWNAQTGKRTLELGDASAHTTALAFDPARTQLVTGGDDGSVRFWSTRDGALLSTWPIAQGRVAALRVHPDGKRIVVAVWNGFSQIRDVGSGTVLLEVKPDEEGAVPEGLAFSADGNLLLIGGDKRPQVWNLAAGARAETLAGHTDEVYGGAFDHHGRLILTGSGYLHARGEPPEDGNAVRVWDATSGRELLSYRSARGAVTAVSFGADETTILAGSRDGTLRRYACEVCSPLPVLADLVASRLARALSAEERDRYVPDGGPFGWVSASKGGRVGASR